jgi:2-polyprenyl-3-methyl-5-hydroxy-6-metoxy-1,4-benzoquinol methylase
METERTNTITLSILEEATSYHRWIIEKMKPFLTGNILETGAGIGNLTGWLLRQGRVLATDVREDYLNVLREKYRDHPNLVGTLIWDVREGFPGTREASFQTIVCSNVLEHVEKDDLVLTHFYRLLPPGGRLILLVPALKVLYNHLDKGLGHYRRYGKRELLKKMTHRGFTIRYFTYFNLFGILGWYLNGTVLRRSLLPEDQVRVFNRMIPLLMKVEAIIPKWAGQSLIAVGEKS